jgi:hypothetical protein
VNNAEHDFRVFISGRRVQSPEILNFCAAKTGRSNLLLADEEFNTAACLA